MKQKIQIIWFKKNLRISDNEIFHLLNPNIPTLGWFLFEPSIIWLPDYSLFHKKFTLDSLKDLGKNLSFYNIPLLIEEKEWIESLENLEKHYEIVHIFSHEETWNLATFQRDIALEKYLKSQKIPFIQVTTNGIVRRLKQRNNWSKIWNERMKQDLFHPQKICSFWENNFAFSSQELIQKITQETQHLSIQIGWEIQAHKILKDFLDKRVKNYSYHIGIPHLSQNSCSRLSPYITYWNISIKYIVHKCAEKIEILKENPTQENKNHIKQISFFLSRLHWQSHFIQKLESQYDIEFKNLFSAYDTIRNEQNDEIIENFFQGKTWIPFIDACMKCLKNTGWINFRSRAMIVSYICNTMMQPWQAIAPKLAQLFVDYEPGIHYSQIQMQAGTTWINTIRIYNPIKQSKEKDEMWVFIKKWIPELRHLSPEHIHTPWTSCEKIAWYDREIPIDTLNKAAGKILWWIKNNRDYSQEKSWIIEKHASRKTRVKKEKTKKEEKVSNQMELF